MRITRMKLLASLAVLATSTYVACSESTSPGGGGTGTVVVKLTDAPFLSDSVSAVNIHVVRVEARRTAADSAASDSLLDNGAVRGWEVLASPGRIYNLMSLRNGVTATLDTTALAVGTYNALRFIIDPTLSTVVLKNGTVLSGANGGIKFPSGNRSGIKVLLDEPLRVVGGTSTTLLIDFNLNDSFVMRGNSVEKNGLLFKPVIRGSIIDAATVNANVRLANATNLPLNFLQGTTPLASNIASATASSCSSVNAATPGLSVTQGTTALTGLTQTFLAGQSYTIVAYPTSTGTVAFSTPLLTTNTPASGQVGLQVFNAAPTPYDVYVTAPGAALTAGQQTFANIAVAGTTSFISLPTTATQIRVTAPGMTTAMVDLTSTLTAGRSATLVIAPPATGSTTIRAFLVPSC